MKKLILLALVVVLTNNIMSMENVFNANMLSSKEDIFAYLNKFSDNPERQQQVSKVLLGLILLGGEKAKDASKGFIASNPEYDDPKKVFVKAMIAAHGASLKLFESVRDAFLPEDVVNQLKESGDEIDTPSEILDKLKFQGMTEPLSTEEILQMTDDFIQVLHNDVKRILEENSLL